MLPSFGVRTTRCLAVNALLTVHVVVLWSSVDCSQVHGSGAAVELWRCAGVNPLRLVDLSVCLSVCLSIRLLLFRARRNGFRRTSMLVPRCQPNLELPSFRSRLCLFLLSCFCFAFVCSFPLSVRWCGVVWGRSSSVAVALCLPRSPSPSLFSPRLARLLRDTFAGDTCGLRLGYCCCSRASLLFCFVFACWLILGLRCAMFDVHRCVPSRC